MELERTRTVPKDRKIRGVSLVKRRQKGRPGTVTKYAEPQEEQVALGS